MRVLWRALLIVAIFAGVGYATMHLLIARAVGHGAPEYSVRLGGAVGGLFAGGAAASIAALSFLLGGKRKPIEPEDDRS